MTVDEPMVIKVFDFRQWVEASVEVELHPAKFPEHVIIEAHLGVDVSFRELLCNRKPQCPGHEPPCGLCKGRAAICGCPPDLARRIGKRL